MRAWELYGPNDIRFENVEIAAPGVGEVQLKVRAAGICGSDVPRVFVTGAHRSPLVPGHEFAGEVVVAGDALSKDAAGNAEPDGSAASASITASTSVTNGATITVSGKDDPDPDKFDPHKWIGKRVGVFPLIPCRKCPSCLAGKYEMCSNYDYLGSRSDGAFAEYVNVPVRNLIEIPDGVSYEQAAMLEPLAVAVHAIRQVMPWIGRREDAKNCKAEAPSIEYKYDPVYQNSDASATKLSTYFEAEKQKIVVIMGLGTIGRLILAVLLREGFKNVFIIGNKQSQKDATLAAGLEESHFIDVTKISAATGSFSSPALNEAVKTELYSRTNGHGADYFFECIGKNDSINTAIDAAAPSGKIVFVGNPASDMTIPKDTYWQILRRQLEIRGTWNSSFTGEEDDDWHYAMAALTDGSLDIAGMITHRLPLDDLLKGLEIMRDKTEEYCKIMITV